MSSAAAQIGPDPIAHWPFDEGAGETTDNIAGDDNDGTLINATWGSDEIRDTYIIFNGADSVVDPNFDLPVMTAENNFTWAAWANNQTADGMNPGTSIIVGNRRNRAGVDTVPRQFIKLTPNEFEFHQNGGSAADVIYPAPIQFNTWNHLAVVKTGTTLTYFLNGIETASSTINSEVGTELNPVFIGGEVVPTGPDGALLFRAAEHFNGFIDDVRLYDQALTEAEINEIIGDINLAPAFTEPVNRLDPQDVDVAVVGSIAATAIDPNDGDVVTYSLLSGPDWLTVATDGTLSGTPTSANLGFNTFEVQASDGTLSTTGQLIIEVVDPNATPNPDGLWGHWPLTEGQGDALVDISGNGRNAFIVNVAAGGLAPDNGAWITDETLDEDDPFRTVLSFNGNNANGAYASVGIPGALATLPLFTLENDFSWAVWIREDAAQELNGDTIVGNRFDANGMEPSPRAFTKITPRRFEFDGGAGQNLVYDEFPDDVWVHNVVVKDGASLTYYRDGVETNSITIGSTPQTPVPVHFGGFGRENWRGSLSDIRLYERALSGDEALALFEARQPDQRVVLDDFFIDDRTLELSWLSEANTTYIVEYSLTLQPGEWITLDTVESQGNGTEFGIDRSDPTFPLDDEKLFFRVREEVPETPDMPEETPDMPEETPDAPADGDGTPVTP